MTDASARAVAAERMYSEWKASVGNYNRVYFFDPVPDVPPITSCSTCGASLAGKTPNPQVKTIEGIKYLTGIKVPRCRCDDKGSTTIKVQPRPADVALVRWIFRVAASIGATYVPSDTSGASEHVAEGRAGLKGGGARALRVAAAAAAAAATAAAAVTAAAAPAEGAAADTLATGR